MFFKKIHPTIKEMANNLNINDLEAYYIEGRGKHGFRLKYNNSLTMKVFIPRFHETRKYKLCVEFRYTTIGFSDYELKRGIIDRDLSWFELNKNYKKLYLNKIEEDLLFKKIENFVKIKLDQENKANLMKAKQAYYSNRELLNEK